MSTIKKDDRVKRRRRMSKIMAEELWDNFSFVVRDNRTGDICYVKIRDFFENTKTAGGGR